MKNKIDKMPHCPECFCCLSTHMETCSKKPKSNWECAYDGAFEKLPDGRCAVCGRATADEAKRDALAWDKANHIQQDRP